MVDFASFGWLGNRPVQAASSHQSPVSCGPDGRPVSKTSAMLVRAAPRVHHPVAGLGSGWWFVLCSVLKVLGMLFWVRHTHVHRVWGWTQALVCSFKGSPFPPPPTMWAPEWFLVSWAPCGSSVQRTEWQWFEWLCSAAHSWYLCLYPVWADRDVKRAQDHSFSD